MPLRSASELPASPEPEALEDTYQECRAALVSANRSRGALKAESERRGVEMFRRLVQQAKRWRTVKARAATLAAEAANEAGASGQLGRHS
jgi:hypothetical protein